MGYPLLLSHMTVDQHELLFKSHGTSLQSHIEQSTFQSTKIHEYLYNLVDLLEVMHELGYAHGNIKPSNIVINKKGKVHLVGFTSAECLIDYDGEHIAHRQDYS